MIALRQWALTAGQWTGAVTDMGGRVRIAAYPAAGGAYSMYGSTSPHIDIQADQGAGDLTPASVAAGVSGQARWRRIVADMPMIATSYSALCVVCDAGSVEIDMVAIVADAMQMGAGIGTSVAVSDAAPELWTVGHAATLNYLPVSVGSVTAQAESFGSARMQLLDGGEIIAKGERSAGAISLEVPDTDGSARASLDVAAVTSAIRVLRIRRSNGTHAVSRYMRCAITGATLQAADAAAVRAVAYSAQVYPAIFESID